VTKLKSQTNCTLFYSSYINNMSKNILQLQDYYI